MLGRFLSLWTKERKEMFQDASLVYCVEPKKKVTNEI